MQTSRESDYVLALNTRGGGGEQGAPTREGQESIATEEEAMFELNWR